VYRGSARLLSAQPSACLHILPLPQIPQLGVCLNKVPLSDRNIMIAQIKNK
jgi:hypothetical protein